MAACMSNFNIGSLLIIGHYHDLFELKSCVSSNGAVDIFNTTRKTTMFIHMATNIETDIAGLGKSISLDR